MSPSYDPTFTPPPFYDQRGPGFDRVVNGRIDIGSFEVQADKPPVHPPPTHSHARHPGRVRKSNRRSNLPGYAAYEIHPVMKIAINY